MRARQWLLGFAGAGAVLGLTAAGCGSSSSGGSSNAGDGGDDGSADVACLPQAVVLPEAGACSACITSMCGTQLMACNQDCTCGGTVDTVAMCLAQLPPVAADAGGGITALLGTFTPLLSCLGGSGLAAGGGGLLGGGTTTGGGASSATTAYLECLVTSCMTGCVGTGDGGAPDGGTGAETGVPEGSAPDTGSSEASAVDAPSDSSAAETSAVDAPSDAPADSTPDAVTE